jgi:KTSC domain
MNRQPVDSSNLKSVGYDKASQTLEIEFQNGGIYEYYDVPEEEYDDLMSASSKGSYFMSNIRPIYSYDKVSRSSRRR